MRLRSRRVRVSTAGLIAAALVAALLVPIAAASPLSAQPTTLHGRVLTGATALEGFGVTLYATSGGGGPPDTLATATSAADGSFDLSYDVPGNPGAVVYLLASNTTAPPDPGHHEGGRDERWRERVPHLPLLPHIGCNGRALGTDSIQLRPLTVRRAHWQGKRTAR